TRRQRHRPARHRPRTTGRAGRGIAAFAASLGLSRGRLPGVGLDAQYAPADGREAAPPEPGGSRRQRGLTAMREPVASVRERSDVRADALPVDELLEAGQPVVLRALVRDWELTRAGQRSTTDAMA